jgi:hypothetical protein
VNDNNNNNPSLSYTYVARIKEELGVVRHFCSADSVRDDLTANKDKPMWPLSSYGPAKGEPLVIPGLDLSFEEMRVKAFEVNKAGNAQEYVGALQSGSRSRLLNSLNRYHTKLLRLPLQRPISRYITPFTVLSLSEHPLHYTERTNQLQPSLRNRPTPIRLQ